MNIFEYASRKKLRFSSPAGLLSVEELWDLKLTSRNKNDLDSIAIDLDNQLSQDVKSFVRKPNPSNKDLIVKRDIVLHIIEVKMAEQEAAEKAQEIASRRNLIEQAIARKKLEQIDQADLASLEKELAELKNS